MTFWGAGGGRAVVEAAGTLAAARAPAVVFGSSREVYGDILQHVTDESMADFVVAESPYSASKIAGEAFFSSYAKCYNITDARLPLQQRLRPL